MDVPTLAKRRCASGVSAPPLLLVELLPLPGPSTENASGASASGAPEAARPPLPGAAPGLHAAAGLPRARGRTTRRALRRSVCGSHGSAASGTGAAPGGHSASSSSSSSSSRCPHTKHVNTSRLTSSGASTCTRWSPCGVATTTVSGALGESARGGGGDCTAAGTGVVAGVVLASGGDVPVRLWCAMRSWGVRGGNINFG